MQTNEIIQVNTIDQYNKLFGIETRHPLIGIVDLNRPEQLIPYKMNIGFYALVPQRGSMRRTDLAGTPAGTTIRRARS